MGSMDIEKEIFVWNAIKTFTSLSIQLIIFIYSAHTIALDLQITPSLTLTELYSDNINLAPSGSEKSAFVTEISPGVSIRGKTARNILNLDYRMENLHNSGGRNKIDTLHQLQFDSNSEILRNSLFIDLNSSIDQQNTSNIRSSNDNASGGGNRTNVTSYGISPYWTPHLNGYADGEVRFNYNKLTLDSNLALDRNLNTSARPLASDTENYEYSARLDSGRRFSWVSWFADYDRREQKRKSGNDVIFQDALVELRTHINRHVSMFTQLGHSDNSFSSTTGNNKNGFFYSFGGRWKPSERFIIEAALGNNSFVSLGIKPTRRMNWITIYRYNDIGSNTGSVWETSFDYRTKRTIWKAGYLEDVTTLQSELLAAQSFIRTDPFENPLDNPAGEQADQFDIALPDLRDDVILTKTADISVAYRTGKSDFSLRAFSIRTIFQASQDKNNVVGVNGSWDWHFFRRSTFFISPSWQRTKRTTGTSSKDDRYDLALGLTRRIPFSIGRLGELKAGIEYRYINQTSDLSTNEFTENRFLANLLLSF